MSIAAYDGSVALPSPSSKLVTVQPDSVPWPITVHLACVDPPNLTHIAGSQPYTPPLEAAPHDLPTTLYESASGVPGSLALLDIPLIPSSEDAVNPGRWLFDLQTEGKVGRVCTWDRPGYGFSQVLGNADLGKVADALWLALESAGETEGREFVLVGEGYGG
jgi:pimeloyl-ACP methyl ester carboxylesterase